MKKIGQVDSHAHLQDFDPGTDISEVLDKAFSVGLTHIVCNGTSESSWSTVLGYSRQFTQVIPCFGVHPWFIEECSPQWDSVLEGYLTGAQSGVGEIGLDHLKEYSDRRLQEEFFRRQLDIARKFNRPVMIHCVHAWGQLMEILRSEDMLPAGFLLHSYAGSPDLVKELADKGAFFSFCGKVLNANYNRARASLRVIPKDRLLIETDAPCMLPPDKYALYTVPSARGTHNHPANLPCILNGIAEFLNEDAEHLREKLWNNSKTLFGRIMDIEL